MSFFLMFPKGWLPQAINENANLQRYPLPEGIQQKTYERTLDYVPINGLQNC